MFSYARMLLNLFGGVSDEEPEEKNYVQQLDCTSHNNPAYYMYNGLKITSKCSYDQHKLDAIAHSPKFRDWFDRFDQDLINMTEFVVTDSDFFGPVTPSLLGFVKGYGEATDLRTGKRIVSNIAFIRGGSVAVLIVVTVAETNEKYVVLCRQLRFPVGKELTEACAGMLDDNVDDSQIEGVVFKELKEEAGFDIKTCELIRLGKITPSGGGCDEVITLFAWETTITLEEFEKKERGVFGENDGEVIKLKCYRYDEFDIILDIIGDVKAECCWIRYKLFINNK